MMQHSAAHRMNPNQSEKEQGHVCWQRRMTVPYDVTGGGDTMRHSAAQQNDATLCSIPHKNQIKVRIEQGHVCCLMTTSCYVVSCHQTR